jgi:hypothetical protein
MALLTAGVALGGFFPIEEDPFVFAPVPSNLNGEVGVWVAIVGVPTLAFLVKFDKNFFVEPGLGGKASVRPIIPLEVGPLSLRFVGWMFLVVLHQKGDDFQRLIFHPLDIKIDFGADLMLGRFCLFGGVDVGVVGRTPMTAADDHPLARLFLEVIHELNENGVDVFFAPDDRKSVPRASFAVGEGQGRFFWIGIVRDYIRRIQR